MVVNGRDPGAVVMLVHFIHDSIQFIDSFLIRSFSGKQVLGIMKTFDLDLSGFSIILNSVLKHYRVGSLRGRRIRISEKDDCTHDALNKKFTDR